MLEDLSTTTKNEPFVIILSKHNFGTILCNHIYVKNAARQLGFEDPNEYPQLCKLANGYLLKTKGYDENVDEYLENEAERDSLYVHLLEEFDRCILTYFSFNWTQSSNLISQVL